MNRHVRVQTFKAVKKDTFIYSYCFKEIVAQTVDFLVLENYVIMHFTNRSPGSSQVWAFTGKSNKIQQLTDLI